MKTTSRLSHRNLGTKPWLAFLIASGMAISAHADVVLRGNIGPRVIDDDVIIATNTECTLNGTVINGNVRLQEGARLTSKRGFIEGNVIGQVSSVIDLRAFTRVDGNVQGDGTKTVIVRAGTTVGGDVQVKNSRTRPNSDALLVNLATVKGDIQAQNNSSRLRIIGTKVDGNIQIMENKRGPYRIANNRVKGDLQFFKNRGPGTIVANRVQGNLQSKENVPRPAVSGNIVSGDTEVQ